MDKPLLADGFERAFVGIAQRCGQPDLAVYDYGAAVVLLVNEEGMTPPDAMEYLDFNVVGAWMGEGTPLWVTTMSLSDALESWE